MRVLLDRLWLVMTGTSPAAKWSAQLDVVVLQAELKSNRLIASTALAFLKAIAKLCRPCNGKEIKDKPLVVLKTGV